jgi:serine phosphatase RsbU (regulator of sigma subunit)
VQFGVINKPFEGELACGDAYFIKEFGNKILISVIDGLGHGINASISANKALNYFEKNYKRSLKEIIKGCHEELKQTRGAVIGIALIDLDRSILTYSGIGNIEIRIKSITKIRPISANGILGNNLKMVRVEEFPYHRGDIIILYSDGISPKFDLDRYPPLFFRQHPQKIAEEIASEFEKKNDDVTILVAREGYE